MKVVEPRELFVELQLDRPDGPVALLGDVKLSLPVRFRFFVLEIVVFLAMDQQDDVRVLFDGAGLAQVAEQGALVLPALRHPVQLRHGDDGDVQLSGEALEEATAVHGAPEIFNTDQGSQFTSQAFTDVLKAHNVRISMDGKGRWLDNVFVERLWRSLKYEEVYLKAYESVAEARRSIGDYFQYFNSERGHQSLGMATPDEVFYQHEQLNEAA